MKLTTVLMLMYVLIISSPSYGQDFDKLLEAVNKIEQNLTNLVEKESQTRAGAIAQLRKEIDSNLQRNDLPGEGAVTNSVFTELELLNHRIDSMAAAMNVEADLASIVADMAALRAELATLRAGTDENRRLLTSLDDQGFYVPEEQNQLLDQIYQRLGVINEQLSSVKPGTNSDVNPARVNRGKISVTGLLHQHFTDQSNERSTFTSKRAQVGVSGELNQYSRIKILADFAASPVLQDAEMTLSPHSQWSLSFGQYKTPFGTDYLTATSAMPFVNAAMATALGPSRDIGAGLSFKSKLAATTDVKLTVGLFNGSGINTSDANSRKNIVFRGEFGLPSGFSFAPNVLTGNTNLVDDSALDLTTYGASLGWRQAKTQLLGEFTYSSVGETDKAGWYLWACQGVNTGWKFLPEVEFLTRYEQMDPSRSVSGNTLARLTFGANLLVDGKYTKLQFNYELDDDGERLGEQARLAVNLQATF